MLAAARRPHSAVQNEDLQQRSTVNNNNNIIIINIILFQRLSVLIQRYNAILLHDCFVKEEEE